MKEQHPETFIIVKQIIDEWDPMASFPLVPEDEHEPEIANIIPLLTGSITLNTLSEDIERIFSNAFDKKFDTEECRLIAQKILNNEEKQKPCQP